MIYLVLSKENCNKKKKKRTKKYYNKKSWSISLVSSCLLIH